jgi:Fructose-2,6-bisphosphatase
MQIYLIRHGKTKGNIERRYMGSTNENLCNIGISELKKINYPKVDYILCSPMKRCLETADIIYADANKLNYKEMELLKEIDFGKFENKTYEELRENKDYCLWLNSMGENGSTGESKTEFINRCVFGFKNIVGKLLDLEDKKGSELSIALIVHGGTIMAILSKLAKIEREYYNWQVENAYFYTTNVNVKCFVNGYRFLDININ